MNRTILEQALQMAEDQQGVATEALSGLHKVQTLCLMAKESCQSVNDYENALRSIYQSVLVSLSSIEGILQPPRYRGLAATDIDPVTEHDRQEWANVYAQNELS